MIDFHTHLADISCFPEYFLNGISEELSDDLNLPKNTMSNNSILFKIIENILSDKNCEKLLKQMADAKIDKSILLIPDLFLFKGIDNDSNDEIIKDVHQKYCDVIKKIMISL